MATIKQKKAFKEVVNGSTITKAMKEAGYSIESSKRTNKVTATKGWQELMDKFIPDKDLAKVHKEGLSATTFYSEGIGKGETVLVEKPDFSVRHKYLESGYKIKGKHLNESEGNKTLIINITGETASRYGILPEQK